jgi:hypothetical protein
MVTSIEKITEANQSSGLITVSRVGRCVACHLPETRRALA